VGYEEGGQLTEAVRRKPYSVVLFDEVEKAHPDVFNTLLQVLDDGRLTDAQGRTVNFRNTVIIMTSNIGSQYLTADAAAGGEIKPDARERVLAEMRDYFRPEFLNRLDDIVLFKPLTLAEIEHIVDLMLGDVRSRLADRQMQLEVSEGAKHFIAEQGFDPVYGARPLRRFIAREVETRIGRALLAGDARDGAVIRVDYSGGELTVSYENPS
jgi:ATP-dependent Clp protease ATP-binding subunit ClpB